MILSVPDHCLLIYFGMISGKLCGTAEHIYYLREPLCTLYGSKVSRESDLRSVPYNRHVSVRSFVENVKSLSENQHNLEPYKIT